MAIALDNHDQPATMLYKGGIIPAHGSSIDKGMQYDQLNLYKALIARHAQ